MLRQGLKQWCKDNGFPSFPAEDVTTLLDRLWQQHRAGLSNHIRKQTITSLTSTFPGAVFHCEDKQASSLRIFCPVLYHSAISKTFLDKDVFEILTLSKDQVLETMIRSLQQDFGRSYPWALGKGQLLPSGYILPKKKKAYLSGRPIISFVDVPFRWELHLVQPRFCWFLYQHRSRQIPWRLVYAIGLSRPTHGCHPRPIFLGLSGQIQQPWGHHQGQDLSSAECHPETSNW